MEYTLGAVANFKLFGFATGNYSCKCNCGIEFIGDKRSSMCLKCAIEQAESFSLTNPPTIHNSDYAKCKIEAEIKRLEENPEGDYITRISALEWALRIIAER